MAEAPHIHVLAAVAPATLSRYREVLSRDPLIRLSLVTEQADVRAFLAQSQRRADILVLDHALCDAYALITELRQTFPRLLILLVDEGADFSTPGRADDVSINPFENDDLLKRIKRLAEERQLETLRTDAFPAVRTIAQQLRRAGAAPGKQKAAVEAVAAMGYDYVAYYALVPTTPPTLSLSSQAGPPHLTGSAPPSIAMDGSLLGWVAESGQSRVVGPADTPNHPLIAQGHLAAGAAVPVGTNLRFGVLLACRAQEHSITGQHVMVLELVSAQLANALAKQQI